LCCLDRANAAPPHNVKKKVATIDAESKAIAMCRDDAASRL
jgi:hypothetical protein